MADATMTAPIPDNVRFVAAFLLAACGPIAPCQQGVEYCPGDNPQGYIPYSPSASVPVTVSLANGTWHGELGETIVPFQNIPTTACRSTPLSPPALSIPGPQKVMQGAMTAGTCTTIRANGAFANNYCDLRIRVIAEQVVLTIAGEGSDAACAVHNGTFEYALKP